MAHRLGWKCFCQTEEGDEQDNPAGECRRHAPQPDANQEKTTWWPEVLANEWCGEFKLVEQAGR
jgi:hypothetical protein